MAVLVCNFAAHPVWRCQTCGSVFDSGGVLNSDTQAAAMRHGDGCGPVRIAIRPRHEFNLATPVPAP